VGSINDPGVGRADFLGLGKSYLQRVLTNKDVE